MKFGRIGVIGLVTALALAGCTGDDSSPGSDDGVALVTGTPLYLTDGSLGAPSIQQLPPGTMTGTVGTVPGAEVSDEFRALLGDRTSSSSTIAYSYAPETYDAVILTALAVQAAGSDGSSDVAAAMADVASHGQACTSFADCNSLLQEGVDIDYQGQSGPVDLDARGGVESGTIGVFSYDDQNLVPGYTGPASADAPVDYVDGDVPSPKSPPEAPDDAVGPSHDDQLVLGGLLPGDDLRGFAPPLKAAAKAAVREINGAGGVLGRQVLATFESAGGSDETAQSGASALLAESVDVIISAASSSSTLSALDDVVGSGAVMVSSAGTAPSMATADRSARFFRIAPADQLQADVLAQQIVDAGATRVAVIARNDVYGRQLSRLITDDIVARDADVVAAPRYRVGQTSFGPTVDEVATAEPDAIVLVGFEESSELITELAAQGLGPQSP